MKGHVHPEKRDCTVPLCWDFLISKSGDHPHIPSLDCTPMTMEICFLRSDGELLVEVFPIQTCWFSILVVCWNFRCMLFSLFQSCLEFS